MADREEQAERVFSAFRRVIAAVVLFNEQIASRTGLSLTESQFLHLLDLHGPMSPSDLGRAAELGSGTVTGVLDRLANLGLVHPERHETHRRKVVVVLDQAKVGRQLAPLFAVQGAMLAGVIKRFDDDQLAVI